MSENTQEVTEELSPEEAASQAMNALVADKKQYLTAYLRLNVARLNAERELEQIVKDQKAAWAALTSEKKGGFTEEQLKKQSILAPAGTTRRRRSTTTKRKPAPQVETAPETTEHHGSTYGG